LEEQKGNGMTNPKSQITNPKCEAAILLLWVVLLPGCSRKPQAPALRDEPVYENAQEGFRFLAPENWTQHARAALPPGKVDKERLLVGYRRDEAGKSALLEVSRADLPESTKLTDYLSGPAFSARQWKAKGPPEELEINGVRAVRNVFLTGAGKKEEVREVVTFRRGERCYFFSGLYFVGMSRRAKTSDARSAASSGKSISQPVD